MPYETHTYTGHGIRLSESFPTPTYQPACLIEVIVIRALLGLDAVIFLLRNYTWQRNII